MHHKFVLLDEAVLLTGSFNFTYAASKSNFENLLLTDDAFFVLRYAQEFERLWARFWGGIHGVAAHQSPPADVSHLAAVVRLQAIQRGRSARRASERRRSTLAISDRQAFPELGR